MKSHEQGMASNGRGAGRVIASLALLVATLLIAAVVLEIAVRFLAPQPIHAFRFTTNTWWEPTPGAAFTYRRSEFRQRIQYNSHGLRDREVTYEKPEGVRRIVVIGDSYAEARQVALHETFCTRLEEKLNQDPDAGPVQVINLGVSGFGTIQQMKRLDRLGFRYEPDWVLYLACTNDYWDNLSPKSRRFYETTGDGIQLRDAEVGSSTVVAYRFRNFLKRYVHLYTFLQDRLQSLRAESPDPEETGGPAGRPPDAHTEVMRLALREIKAMCTEHSAGFAASIVTLRDPDSSDSLASHFGDLCQQEGIPFVDLTPAFSSGMQAGDQLFYQIDAHWNPAGHDLTADVLAEFFRRRILGPRDLEGS